MKRLRVRWRIQSRMLLCKLLLFRKIRICRPESLRARKSLTARESLSPVRYTLLRRCPTGIQQGTNPLRRNMTSLLRLHSAVKRQVCRVIKQAGSPELKMYNPTEPKSCRRRVRELIPHPRVRRTRFKSKPESPRSSAMWAITRDCSIMTAFSVIC